VAPQDRQDPAYFRGGSVGRDGCRVPCRGQVASLRTASGPDSGQPRLSQPAHWRDLSVDAQRDDPESTLELYRRALRSRREVTASLAESVMLLESAPGALSSDAGTNSSAVVNCGDDAAALPGEAGEVVLTSGPLPGDGTLPPDTAAWFRASRS